MFDKEAQILILRCSVVSNGCKEVIVCCSQVVAVLCLLSHDAQKVECQCVVQILTVDEERRLCLSVRNDNGWGLWSLDLLDYVVLVVLFVLVLVASVVLMVVVVWPAAATATARSVMMLGVSSLQGR